MTESLTTVEQFRAFLIEAHIAKTKIDAIVEKFEDLQPGNTAALVIDSARVTVETIEAYGLEIELDAYGQAGRVSQAGLHGSARINLDMSTEYYA